MAEKLSSVPEEIVAQDTVDKPKNGVISGIINSVRNAIGSVFDGLGKFVRWVGKKLSPEDEKSVNDIQATSVQSSPQLSEPPKVEPSATETVKKTEAPKAEEKTAPKPAEDNVTKLPTATDGSEKKLRPMWKKQTSQKQPSVY